MSVGLTRFVVENGRLFRISRRLFDELWEGTTSIERFASRTIQFVDVYLEYRQRKPIKIREIRNEPIQFNARGHIDRDAILREVEMAYRTFTTLIGAEEALSETLSNDGKIVRLETARRTLSVEFMQQLTEILKGAQSAPWLRG